MPIQIGINVGFVTNSSSMVYHFPREILNDPKIQAFLKAFEIEDGFVGADLWSRNACGTLAITTEQKAEVRARLADTEYGGAPAIDDDPNLIVVIYGDEHHQTAAIIAEMLRDLGEARGMAFSGQDYN